MEKAERAVAAAPTSAGICLRRSLQGLPRAAEARLPRDGALADGQAAVRPAGAAEEEASEGSAEVEASAVEARAAAGSATKDLSYETAF